MKDTTMNKVYSWKDFEPKATHEFLFDNSVLLFPFAPIGNYSEKTQKSISRFLATAKSSNCGLHTTSLNVAEFQNKVFQDFFHEWKIKPENVGKKLKGENGYRNSSGFENDILAINSAVKNILKLFNRFPDNFNSINVNAILDNTFSIDFNDAYLIELCNQNNWIIVTRDRDIIDNKDRTNPVLSFLD